MPPLATPSQPHPDGQPHLPRDNAFPTRDATRTVEELLRNVVLPRQATSSYVSVPANYGGLGSSPGPGAVVGITLGAVAGFLLLLWAVYSCLNIGPPTRDTSSYTTGSVLTLRSRRPHRHSRSPRRRVTETVEVHVRDREARDRGSAPIIVDAAPERVSAERRPPRGPPPRVVDVSDDSADEVVVIEEHSPPRRNGRRSSDRRRSSVHDDRRGSRRISRDR